MKRVIFILINGIIFMASVEGIFSSPVVNDPLHMAKTVHEAGENAKRHIDTLNKWRENFALIKDQIEKIRHMQEAIGDPKKAGLRYGNKWLNGHRVNDFWEQEYAFKKLKRDSQGLRSLLFEDAGVFKQIRAEDDAGTPIERNLEGYKRHDALEQQHERVTDFNEETSKWRKNLHKEALETLEAVKNAETEAERTLLAIKLGGINGEMAMIDSLRQDEMNELVSQEILNENQKEKEKRAALEDFIHEQTQEDESLANYLRGFKYKKL